MMRSKMTLGGKILIAAIVLVGAWLLFRESRESARIADLASLPPCRLAAEYAAWRLRFEDEHPAADATGPASDEFVETNELFEQAVRRARDETDSPVLRALEDLTAVDSAEWIRERGDIDTFVEVMLAECPEEVEELIRTTGG